MSFPETMLIRKVEQLFNRVNVWQITCIHKRYVISPVSTNEINPGSYEYKKKSGYNPNLETRKRQLKIIFRLIQQLALIIFPKCTIKFFPLCLTVCNYQECRFKVHGHKNVGPRYTTNIRIS